MEKLTYPQNLDLCGLAFVAAIQKKTLTGQPRQHLWKPNDVQFCVPDILQNGIFASAIAEAAHIRLQTTKRLTILYVGNTWNILSFIALM